MKFFSTRVRLLIAFFLFIILIIFSCRKETSETLSPQDEQLANVAASESDAEAENVFNGVFDDVMGVNTEVGMGGTGLFMRSMAGNYGTTATDARTNNIDPAPSCLNLTIQKSTSGTSPFPITVTFDFGSGCYAPDGHVRKGKIITTYTDRLLHTGATATIQFEDFYIDSLYIENSTSFTITNTGTQDRLQFTIDIHAKLTKSNGNYTEWYSHKVITRIEGGLTITPLDDIMQIEGNASGKVKKNDLAVAWRAEISDPLIKKFTCRWISKGTVKISRENLSANSQWIGSLNYGNGDCDKFATLIINGITIQITLH
jgi:hypothetical protein